MVEKSDRSVRLKILQDKTLVLVKGNKENTLLISGRGGLPEDPKQYLRGQAVWQDL